MSKREDSAIIQDMKEAMDRIMSYTLNMEYDGFLQDYKTQDAVIRLALAVDGNCVLSYDNETGKGDHKHIGEDEKPYIFTSPEALIDDFWNDVKKWRF